MTQEQLQALLEDLTLEEKAFQLSQVPARFYVKNAQVTGTNVSNDLSEQELSLVGSILNVYGAKETIEIQEGCMAAHPHHIPMLFMMDVIHGHRTVFPMPLAMGASFDPEGAEEMMRIAAKEASAVGVTVAFAPMLDLVRDPRWGRVMESSGEDPYLNSVMGRAMVRGLQGNPSDRSAAGRISACVKHFAAYGAPEGGREYQNSELSEHTLREYYLPAYRAAVDAGADMVMSAFQTLNGIPAAANRWLLRDILRGEWGFDGVIITDWGALAEMVKHGVCADLKEASFLAFQAGVDIDMCSMAYHRYLPELVREGRIPEHELNRSVMRVLQLKNKLGLFENPRKDAGERRVQEVTLLPAHRASARKAVSESLVLLKNEGDQPLLPLGSGKRIALIGPYVNSRELHSTWALNGLPEDTVSMQQAAEELSGYRFVSAQGCKMMTRKDLLDRSRERSIPGLRQSCFDSRENESDPLLAEAVQKAAEEDCAVLCLGEHRSLSGEAASRSEITLPAEQLALLRAVAQVNRNIVTVVFGGRVLDLREVCRLSRSVVMAWLPGTEGGHGILDVLTGKENFSGKLPMSIPVSVGQIPVSYNQLRTGRPKDPVLDDPTYRSAYLDIPNAPLYPFGYGLSYSHFTISPVTLSAAKICGNIDLKDSAAVLLSAAVEVQNCSDREGTVILQLYLRDDVASLARPVRELKAFQRVTLVPGEKRTVTFPVTANMLSFVSEEGLYVLEPGSFTLWIGEDSDTDNQTQFMIEKES